MSDQWFPPGTFPEERVPEVSAEEAERRQRLIRQGMRTLPPEARVPSGVGPEGEVGPGELGLGAAAPTEIIDFIRRTGDAMSPEELAEWAQQAGITPEQAFDLAKAGAEERFERLPTEPYDWESRRGGVTYPPSVGRMGARPEDPASFAARRQAIMNLIKSGNFQPGDPILAELSREFANLRKREQKAAVFGTLGRMVSGAAGAALGKEMPRPAIVPGPDPWDTTEKDKATALEAYKAGAKQVPKLYEIDSKNIKEARELMIALIDQVRQRGDAVETRELEARISMQSTRESISLAQMTLTADAIAAREGKYGKVRNETQLRSALANEITRMHANQDLAEVELADIFRKTANNSEELDALRNTVAPRLLGGTSKVAKNRRKLITGLQEGDTTAVETVITEAADATEEMVLESAYGVGITPEEFVRQIDDDERWAPDDTKNAAKAIISGDTPGWKLLVEEMETSEGVSRFVETVTAATVGAGNADQDLRMVGKELVQAIGYKTPEDLINAVMGQGLTTKQRSKSVKKQEDRQKDLTEAMLKKQNPFRTRQFKQQLLLPENRKRLAALDAYARDLNLNRDDALRALAIQFARDRTKQRQVRPNVLAELEKGATRDELLAKKALKPIGEVGTKPGLDVVMAKPTPAPPAADVPTKKKPDEDEPLA
jgi:hypothetical protein